MAALEATGTWGSVEVGKSQEPSGTYGSLSLGMGWSMVIKKRHNFNMSVFHRRKLETKPRTWSVDLRGTPKVCQLVKDCLLKMVVSWMTMFS